MNNGPEENVEFSILMQTSFRQFSIFLALKMNDLTKQNFTSKLAFD